MNALAIAIAVLIYAATIYGGVKIYRWKYRLSAIVYPVIFPFVGFLFALFLDARCRQCDKLMSMAASVCPHCGRNVRDGRVTVRR